MLSFAFSLTFLLRVALVAVFIGFATPYAYTHGHPWLAAWAAVAGAGNGISAINSVFKHYQNLLLLEAKKAGLALK